MGAPRPSNKRTAKGFLPTLRRWKKLAVFTCGATLLFVTIFSCAGSSTPMRYSRRLVLTSKQKTCPVCGDTNPELKEDALPEQCRGKYCRKCRCEREKRPVWR